MVGKFLCNSWNELVDAAAFALDQLGKSHTTNWAKQMKKAAHVTGAIFIVTSLFLSPFLGA